jgi:hypothetical protein
MVADEVFPGFLLPPAALSGRSGGGPGSDRQRAQAEARTQLGDGGVQARSENVGGTASAPAGAMNRDTQNVRIRTLVDAGAGMRPRMIFFSSLRCKGRLKVVVCEVRNRYREFESTPLRQRVPISGDTAFKTLKQRAIAVSFADLAAPEKTNCLLTRRHERDPDAVYWPLAR